ncbi:MAG: ATP-dependent Clp protease ATP-binding subunit, partial [Oscillospiraceae bacterium]|nr:ATP-dependent Clp protease ATP-binding subunit [Oscillospiraceae bacterium]
MICAKQMNIPQVSDYMRQMGISDEELEQISDQMMELMDGDSFEMGGSGIMPNFLQDMMKSVQNAQKKEESDEEESSMEMLDSIAADGDDSIEPDNPFEALFGKKNTEKERKGEKRKKRKELKFLGNYCTNLSERAAEGKLDNIIGRDREISRVIQILSRRTKNNPCLIGEPGVGKTAIAEGIAQRINAGNVPFNLMNKKVYLLDLTS